MRVANVAGRLNVLDADGRATDVQRASDGRFGPDPQTVYSQWEAFREWGAAARLSVGATVDPADLQAVVPRPPQIFAVGLNYRGHAIESGMDLPKDPMVFTKFASSLTGAAGEISVSPGNVDWEVELVAVIGKGGHHIPEEHGWEHVAGLTVGQDISDRTTQFASSPPQFSLGKSYPGFPPIGPHLVTTDELRDPDDLEIKCRVNGGIVQKGRTSDMVFSIPTLVARLSAIVSLLPGDLIFTGTPSGVGVGQKPQRFSRPATSLRPGQVRSGRCATSSYRERGRAQVPGPCHHALARAVGVGCHLLTARTTGHDALGGGAAGPHYTSALAPSGNLQFGRCRSRASQPVKRYRIDSATPHAAPRLRRDRGRPLNRKRTANKRPHERQESRIMTEPTMAWQEMVEFSTSHNLLAKRLYVVSTTPINGLGPILENLEEHVAYQTKLELDGVMFAAGPLASEDLQQWLGEGLFMYRAESMEEATQTAEADPMHSSGARSFTIREWMLNEGTYTVQLFYSAGRPRIT